MPVKKNTAATSAAIQQGLSVRGGTTKTTATKVAAPKAAAKKMPAKPVATKTEGFVKPAPVKATKAATAKLTRKVVAPKQTAPAKPVQKATKPATKPVADNAAKQTTPRVTRLYVKNTKLDVAVQRVSDELARRGAGMKRSRSAETKAVGVAMIQTSQDMLNRPAYWGVPKKNHEWFDQDHMFLVVDFADGTTRVFASDNGDVLATLKGKQQIDSFDYFENQ